MIRAALLGLVLATTAVASTDLRDDLVGKITRLGSHETASTRHTTEVEGCELTISYREDWDAHRLALHSVHHIDLKDYWASEDRPEKRRTPWFALGSTSEVFMIEMRPPARLESELAMRSAPRGPYQMSSREDIDQFVVKQRPFHGLRFDELDEPGRMAALSQAVEEYYHAFCRTTG